MTKREILFLKNGKMETVSRPRMTKGVSCNRYIRTFYLCTHTCPYRLAMLGTSLRVRGKLTLKKKEFIFLYFYIYSFDDILCRILRYESYVFFLPLTFRFCPPLKNDDRSELRYGVTINDFFIRRKKYEMKAVPRHGKQANHFSRSGATL